MNTRQLFLAILFTGVFAPAPVLPQRSPDPNNPADYAKVREIAKQSLLTVAHDLQSQIPVKIDEDTTMISVIFLSANTTMMYSYRVNADAKDVDFVKVQTIGATNSCRIPSTRLLLSFDMNMEYAFYDKNG